MPNKQRMARRPDGKGRPSGNGTTGYDALAAAMNRAIDTRIQATAPRLGTVRSDDGNRVRVDFDDGGSGAAGQSHGQAGGRKRAGQDRVLMFPVGDGEWVAVGPIIDDGRPDRAQIGADDIERDSIRAEHIKENAIQKKHLPNKIIGQNQIDGNAIDQHNLIGRFNNELGRDARISGVDKRVDGVNSRISGILQRLKKLDNGPDN